MAFILAKKRTVGRALGFNLAQPHTEVQKTSGYGLTAIEGDKTSGRSAGANAKTGISPLLRQL
jgi:hypothetical protein